MRNRMIDHSVSAGGGLTSLRAVLTQREILRWAQDDKFINVGGSFAFRPKRYSWGRLFQMSELPLGSLITFNSEKGVKHEWGCAEDGTGWGAVDGVWDAGEYGSGRRVFHP